MFSRFHRRKFGKSGGFTLIEAAVGAAVFAVSAIGIMGLGIMLRRISEEALHSATALNTAQSVMEQLISMPILAPATEQGGSNYLDNSANSLQVVLVPPNAGLSRVTISVNRPPYDQSPENWSWTRVVVPAVASPPSIGGGQPPAPKDVPVLIAVCISNPDPDSPSREIHVYYSYEKPTPMLAFGAVKSIRVVRV